jgi:hypothetical protein
MKRLISLAAAGLMCGATILAMSGTAGASTAGVPVAQPGGLMVRAPGFSSVPTVSLNWSGYAVQSKKTFNSVHSTFVQPALTCDGGFNEWTSNWVGLDGYANSTVEQDGTFAHCGGPNHMTPEYIAWYEMFPAGSVGVFKVTPGDIIDTSVTFGSGTFTLTVADETSGLHHTKTATCASCERTSAEWIIERPASCNSTLTNCFIDRLADFGSSTMAGATASFTGDSVRPMGAFNTSPINMISVLNKGGFISTDTVAKNSGSSFTAQFDRHGTIFPIQLSPRH